MALSVTGIVCVYCVSGEGWSALLVVHVHTMCIFVLLFQPSTEKLLLILFKEFRPLVTPVIVNIISSVRGLYH